MTRATNLDAVKARIEKAQEQLQTQLAALQTSDDWKRTLEFMAILGPLSITRFSFRNFVLLLAQRPSIRHAATFNGWLARERHVKKGEKGLTVLRPRFIKERSTDSDGTASERQKLAGFSYLTVFGLDQTDGQALPEPVRPQPDDNPTAGGWFHLQTHQIVVITGETSPAQQFKTLAHEVAHAILHGDGDHHARSTAEVEAESTAYVVAHALGLDTSSYSLPYVATWALAADEKEPTRVVALVGERVRKAASLILGVLFPDASAATDAADELAA